MKNQLLRKAGQLLGSPAAISLLSNPQFQEALKRAINLRSDVRDGWEGQVEGLARQFNLATRHDVKGLKRTIRELENHLAAMDYELQQMKAREAAARAAVETAEKALEEARQAAAKSSAAKKAAAKKPAAKKAAAKKPAAKKAAAKKPAAKKATAKKPAAKKATAKKPAAKKSR
ncbi:MAG: hypothetical protein ACPGU1_09160 [Myxococcota bacterium]